jgi:hypothetical protein
VRAITVEQHLAPSAIDFGIVFGEADPPFAERAGRWNELPSMRC